ncbi:MAG: ShlB/FhaC/HecB family hemolysin secretion/activation protein [Candidatus Parcubacteria bacterium]|nr:ShlB/FhaC/HecB family hemolysin secretion/activation protein [Burkholderiales bacterium]
MAAATLGSASAQAPEGAQGREAAGVFDILEFQVEGNSVLPPIAIERAVYRFLGPRGSIEQVDKARAQLEKTFHDAGFLTVLVDIPEQQVTDGLVRLRVIEGRLERVRVLGQRYYSQGAIRERVPELTEGSAPYFPDVQDQLAQLNRGADRRVTPVLKPGSAPGTVQVELNVEDKLPLHGSLELNDRYSANTSRLRLSGMLRYENLWQRDHSLTLNFQTSPQDTDEVKVFSASYLMPLAPSDRMLALYAVDSRSNVAAIGTLGVIGRGRIYGARHILPLTSRGNYFHSLSLGLDYKDFQESVTLLGADSLNTPITYAPFQAQYSGTMQDAAGVTQFNLGFNFAVRGLFGNREAEFANKRFKAHANYAYFRGDLQRTQNLPKGWSLLGRLDAQAASQPLISSEQFAAGGYESVRGYLESEVLGDDGLRASLELRAPSFATGIEAIRQFNLVAFYEGARVTLKDPLPGQADKFSLSGAGFGLRLRGWNTVTAALDLAWPLKATANTRSGEAVLRFKLAYEF